MRGLPGQPAPFDTPFTTFKATQDAKLGMPEQLRCVNVLIGALLIWSTVGL